MRLLFTYIMAICLLSCQKEFELTDPIDPNAVFSLSGSPDACSKIVTAGIYKDNLPLTSSNKITVDVDVTKRGNWSASTDTVNGVSFAATSFFSAEGHQTIILQGTGSPVKAGINNFTLKAGSSQCSFVLNIDTSSALPVTNIPPVADAGADKIVTLPINKVALSGSGTDADGTVSSYLWQKISGPGSPAIASPNQAQTEINGLITGSFQFELTVTDNLGANGKDTVLITVKAATANGTFGMQQDLTGVSPINDVFSYDASGKIIKITSNHYPERVITYANDKISTIEYWYDNGSNNGTLYKGETHTFIYDGNNVIKINETDHLANKTFLFAGFTYNADNTLKTKKLYFDSGSTLVDQTFIYTGGNLTGIIQGSNSDTTLVTYDARTNNFKNLYSQFYFLDIQTVFNENYRSEIFYFSKNYPTGIGTLPITVSINPTNHNPFEVMFDNKIWYRYISD